MICNIFGSYSGRSEAYIHIYIYIYIYVHTQSWVEFSLHVHWRSDWRKRRAFKIVELISGQKEHVLISAFGLT